MMNDKEFRKNCKVLANDIVDFYSGWRKSLPEPEHWHSRVADTSELDTAALLYIAANMPSPDESSEKPCEYCDPEKRKIFHNPCGSVSHYLYVNTKQKKLADVYDKTKDKWVEINYCPFCGRKL